MWPAARVQFGHAPQQSVLSVASFIKWWLEVIKINKQLRVEVLQKAKVISQ